MRKPKKVNVKRLTLMLLALFAFIVILTVFFVLLFLNFISDIISTIIFSVLFILASGGLAVAIIMFVDGQQKIKILRKTNLYHFGVDNNFYNYPMFQDKVRYFNTLKMSHSAGYVISFTLINEASENNLTPNIKALHNYMCEYLLDVIVYNQDYGSKMLTCCYYRNAYLIYSFLDLDKTHELIEAIQKKAFEIIKEHELMIFAQPHFGLARITNAVELVKAIDEATLARNYAMRNFEEVTFYRDEFREVINPDEVEELRQAIKNNELVVYYQPKFHLKTRRFVGAEALVRWESPQKGLLLPGYFIKRAEIAGLIHEIDLNVLKQVIRDLKDLKNARKRVLPISINFSLYEFFQHNFISDLKKLIDDSKLDPRLIEIEITETTSQANTFLATSILKKLKDYGLRILMDDFGSGFSNISMLNKLPIDVVKIDKSFIDGLTVEKKNCEIVKFLISLCKVNNLEVIAEGADSKAEVEILEKAKCDVIQGFYYSMPLPLKEYLKFLDDNKFERKVRVRK